MIKYLLLTLIGSIVIDAFFRKKGSVLQNALDSLHTKPEGYSARKIQSYLGVLIAGMITYLFTDKDTVVEVLGIWLTYSLLLLGIVTVADVMKFRSAGGTYPPPPAAAPDAAKPTMP